MGIQLNKMYPKVVAANRRHTMYFHLCGEDLPTAVPEVKIQPMEIYGISHAPDYSSHAADRYGWTALTATADGIYAIDWDFAAEQRYTVKLRVGEDVFYSGYLYAVDPDLAPLRPYKGDTHLHTNRSDGWDEPFAVACAYREAGYDFIAVTDHGRYYPSIDLAAELKPLTDRFYVMPGEEVHPKGGSCFHIVSLNAKHHITEVFEQRPAEAAAAIQHILDTRDLSRLPDPYAAAMRIFIASEIRKAGGVAVMAHPFWECGDEYNYQTCEFLYHWRQGDFDALELLAGCDDTGNGNNLQEILWNDLKAEGLSIPIVGSSDAHVARCRCDYDHFSRQFTLVFATGYDDLADAIVRRRAVAVERHSDKHFRCLGDYRYAKYARFLMAEYYPTYTALCATHAAALAARDTDALAAAEAAIADYQKTFYAV